MFTLLIFLLVIAVLVISHEFGHFIVAKWRGMRVDEFGFGFPPRIYSKKWGDTLYSLNLLPFGGFVKVWGEDDIEGLGDMQNFASHTAWSRFLVLVAGVAMNFLLAYLIFSVGVAGGMPLPGEFARLLFPSNDVQQTVHVGGVVPGSPAEQAGLLSGDTIRQIMLLSSREIIPIASVSKMQEIIGAEEGNEIRIYIIREGIQQEIEIVPRKNPDAERAAIGVFLVEEHVVNVPFWRAPWDGARVTFFVVMETIQGLGSMVANLFTGNTEMVKESVRGPIGIAEIAGETARAGFTQTMLLVAVLSLTLGVLNLLPIPALDGGRIFFLLIEKIRGKPIPLPVSQYAHAAGFVALLLLMLVVTYLDIQRIF